MDSFIFSFVTWAHYSLLRTPSLCFLQLWRTQGYTNSFKLGLRSLEEEYTGAPSEREKQVMSYFFLVRVPANMSVLNAVWFKKERCLQLQLELLKCCKIPWVCRTAPCFECLCLEWMKRSRNCFCFINDNAISSAPQCTDKSACKFSTMQR